MKKEELTPLDFRGFFVSRCYWIICSCFLAPLWTTTADGQVKLRRDPTCSQAPITIHQMFLESLEKYKSLNALASKKEGKWEKITFLEYYHLSRKAAKSFLKVNFGVLYPIPTLWSLGWLWVQVFVLFYLYIKNDLYRCIFATFLIKNNTSAGILWQPLT